MKKGLLVGINYLNMNGELAGCYNDVKNMARILKEKYNYTTIEIISEYDGNKKPTKQNILNGIEWLIKDQDKYNTLFFHYSGHGSSVFDQDNDEEDGRDEVLVPLDYHQSGMIRDDDLNNLIIKRLQSTTKFYSVVDACHSGSIFDLKYTAEPLCKYEGKNKPLFDLDSWTTEYRLKKFNNYSDKPNIFTISGCKDNQTSADAWIKEERSFNGALTYHLLKTLDDFNYNVTMDDFMKKINIYLRCKNYEQRPMFSSGKYLRLDEKFTF
jgi:hypothetical protein